MLGVHQQLSALTPTSRLPQVMVVPCFLTSGGAGRDACEDLPFLLADVQQQVPSCKCVISEAVEVDKMVAEFIEHRVKAVGPSKVESAERNWEGGQRSVAERSSRSSPAASLPVSCSWGRSERALLHGLLTGWPSQ